jgi:hypothetical protein
MMAYTYLINNSTGVVVLNGGGPTVPDWSFDLDPPDPLDVKAAYADLYNAHGWVTGSPLAICGAGSTSIGPNVATFTDNNQIYLYDGGWCMQFYDHMHVSIFGPFTPGAPSASEIDAAFYSSEHGNRLYIVEVP